MDENSLKEYQLGNGLNLEFIDQSKKIAPGRFHLCVLVRMVVPLKMKWFIDVGLSQIEFEKLTTSLGKEVVFQQKKEKCFVDSSLKEKYLNSIVTTTLACYEKYLALPSFPRKLILKHFNEKQSYS